MFVIYMATNRVNGKRYIGYTGRTLAVRRRAHIWKARTGENKARFAQALVKYEAEDFDWTVLCEVETQGDAKAKEIELIALLRPEYNVTLGGDGRRGGKPAHNARPVICLDTGEKFASAGQAGQRVGKSGAQVSRSCRLACIVNGLHFVWNVGQSLTEQDRNRLIADRMITRVQRRKRSGRAAEGMSPWTWTDAIGRSNAGPMANARTVICVDDGMIYQSASAAARAYGVAKSAVVEVCLRKPKRLSAGGLRFAYAEVHNGPRQ